MPINIPFTTNTPTTGGFASRGVFPTLDNTWLLCSNIYLSSYDPVPPEIDTDPSDDPVVTVPDPVERSEEDRVNTFIYPSEATIFGLSRCPSTSQASYDLFNFGYKLRVNAFIPGDPRGDAILTKVKDKPFTYTNNDNYFTVSLSAIGESWKLVAGNITYTNQSVLPIGRYETTVDTTETLFNVVYEQ